MANHTIARNPTNITGILSPATAVPCNIENQDFVMALIYVLNLLLAVVVASVPILVGKHKRWRKDGAFILVTGLLSVGIWVAWMSCMCTGMQSTVGPRGWPHIGYSIGVKRLGVSAAPHGAGSV